MFLGRFLTRSFCRAGAVAVAGVLLSNVAGTAFAQLPQTRLYALYPAGAKAGETVEVTLANGADLDDLNAMLFNHPGIQAKKKDGTTNQFVLTIAGDVPPGVYETRVRGLFGSSNPRSFAIGNLPETREVEPNNAKEQASPATIGSTINGQSNNGADLDFFKFAGKQGQRVLVSCEALRIDSRFQGDLRLLTANGKQLGRATAVGRQNDPVLDVTLTADGEYFLRVADLVYGGSADFVYRLQLHTGPHIDFVSPPAGVPGSTAGYTLFGRNLPGGQPSDVVIDGRKLEKLAVQIALPNTPDKLETSNPRSAREGQVDGATYVFKGPTGASNAVTIGFATKAMVLEVEPNNLAANAQKIQVPIEIAGQFQSRSDIDCFEFEAKAQQVLWVEAIAQRLGSPADPYLTIDKVTRNEKGEETLQRIATQDDTVVNAVDAKLFDTNHDDVSYRFVAPTDGSYRVSIRDRYFEARGAANLQYQLAIREEAPDFRLIVTMPAPLPTAQKVAQGFATSELGIRRGENFDVLVAALRRHGYAGVIDVTAEDLPAGVTCRGASIGSAQNSVSLVFLVAEDAKPVTQAIRIVGKARVESAVAVKAVADAEAALVAAVANVPKLDQALTKSVPPMQQAEAARKPAEEKFNADAALAKKAEEAKVAAEKKVADSDAAAKTATTEKQTAEKALADAKKAAETAAQDAVKAKAALDAKTDDQGLKDALAAAEKKSAEAQVATTTTQQALVAADQKLALANQLLATAKAELPVATNAFNSATQVAKQSTDAKQKAVTAHEQAVAAFQKAEADKKAGDAEVVKTQQAIATARKAREAAAKQVVHDARPSTIVWSGAAAASAVSRLSQTLMLSVIDEVAPLQVTGDVVREVANHNRQIVVSVKLAKRNGFDNNVVLTPQGLPANLTIAPLTIAKGSSEGLLKIFIPNNVKEDTYTISLEGAAQVPYLKNVGRLNRAKAAVETTTAAVTAATEATKKVVADVDAATKLMAATAETLKKTQADLDVAKKKAVDALAATTKAQQDSTAADKVAIDAEAKAKLATEAAALAKTEAAKDATNADLAKKATDSEQAAVAAETARKTAVDAQQAAK